MRLKVQFGLADDKEVFWYKEVEDFPNLIKYLGKNYEWVMYDNDYTGKFDFVLIFSELQSYDPNYNVDCPKWSELFPEKTNACDCGAKYCSFPWDHMRYCPLWKPWNQI